MGKKLLLLLGGLALLVPSVALGTNGDDDGELFPAAEFVGATVPNRAGWSGGIYYLCDHYQVADGNSACGIFDLNTVGGLPDVAIISIASATTCSAAYTADVNTYLGYDPVGDAATTDEHDVVVLDATTTRAVITWPSAVLDRYIAVDIATLTDCTDLTVLIEVRYEKKGNR